MHRSAKRQEEVLSSITMRIEDEDEGKKAKHGANRGPFTTKVALVLDDYAKETTQLYMAPPRFADEPTAA